MNAIAPISLSSRAMFALYLREAKYEFLRLLRTPAFSIPTLVFAPMFYLLFGVLLNGGSPKRSVGAKRSAHSSAPMPNQKVGLPCSRTKNA